MNMRLWPNDVLDWVGYVFILHSIYFGVKYRRFLWNSILAIIPFAIIGTILAFGLAASYTLAYVTLKDNLTVLAFNTYQIIRNSYFAAIGLVIFKILGLSSPVRKWENGFNFLYETPRWLLAIIIIGDVFYGLIIFDLFDINFPQVSFASIIQTTVMGSLGSVVEELLIRLYLLGTLLYLFNRSKHRWIIAIILSSIYWAILHLGESCSESYKIIQVFPFGIVLGYIMKRYGFEASLFIHFASNLILFTLPL